MLLGEIIKQYRLEHNMSLQDFANLIGSSRSYIHMLEKNVNPSTNKPINPSIETLKLLAKAMNMDLEILLKQLNENQAIIFDENQYKEQFKAPNEDSLEIRAIARNVAKLKPEKKELFKQLLKQMSDEANEEKK